MYQDLTATLVDKEIGQGLESEASIDESLKSEASIDEIPEDDKPDEIPEEAPEDDKPEEASIEKPKITATVSNPDSSFSHI